MPTTVRKKLLSGFKDTVYNILRVYTVFYAFSYIKIALPVL